MPLIRPLAAAASAAALVFAVALPAQAAPPPLPSGDALYTVPCWSTEQGLQLHELDAATGAATAVGDAALVGTGCSYDLSWNPIDGLAYGLTEYMTVDSLPSQFLYSVDVVTGEITIIGRYVTEGGTNGPYGSLVIGLDGTAYAVGESGLLATVDLATGEVTLVGTIPGMDTSDYWGSAVDPSTGLFYAIGILGQLLRFDPVDLTSELVGTVPHPTGVAYQYGLTIDSAGTAWIVSSPAGEQDPSAPSALWSTPLSSPGAPELSGSFITTGDSPITFYSFEIFGTWSPPVEPQLAATGVDASSGLAFAAGALGVVAAGVLLLASRRRRA